MLVAAATDALEQFPWPVQLGLMGVFASAWIFTVVRQNAALRGGKLLAAAQIEAERVAAQQRYDDMVAEKDRKYDDMVKIKDAQIAEITVVKNEWHDAHGVSEAGRAEERETTREAVKATRAIEPILAKIAEVGDNGRREGQPL